MKFFTKNPCRILAFAVFLLCNGLHLNAQRTITGTVSDLELGEPLIGVTVIEKENPTNGAVTDIDGKYSLKVSAAATALIYRYTGFEVLELPLGASDVMDATMSNNSTLTEFVKIGYGTVKREDATGLVQSVDARQFNRGAITGAQELLAGKIAGVVINTDPAPGGGAQIRVRGLSSLSASNDPLIVIDGVPMDAGGISGARNTLNLLNPNDIESFTVLRDASSTAIYGNRASGGVILITTKKGNLNSKKMTIGYNANVSFSQVNNQVDVLAADEFRNLLQELVADSADFVRQDALNGLGSANTNWQDEIYRTAAATDHNLNFSGGFKNIPYRLSLGYTHKQGVLKTDNFNRYTAGLNLNPGFLNNTLQTSFGFKAMISQNNFADRGAIGSAVSFDPTKPVLSDTTAFGGYYTWVDDAGFQIGLSPDNPVALLDLREDNSTVQRYLTNASVDYRFPFLPALRANVNLAQDYAYGEGTVVVPPFASFAFDLDNGGGVDNLYSQTRITSTLESYLAYKKKFGIHGFDIMGGYSWQKFASENYALNSDNAGTAGRVVETDSRSELYLVSLFTRLNYSLYDRFLFTASLRQDGTSRFAKEFRTGIFPAAAVAVKVRDNQNKYFNNLKVRASWGITGQQDVGGTYEFLPRYVFSENTAQYQLGDSLVTTLRPNGYIGDIRWEEATTYNAGVDFSIVRDKVSGSLDVYKRYTRDLFGFVSLPVLSNFTDNINQNVGTMEAQGVELSLNFTPVLTKDIRWDLSTNFASTISEITRLRNAEDSTFLGDRIGGISGGVGNTIQVNTVGEQPLSFFVYEQAYENGGLLPGEFIDQNGDGVINEMDLNHYRNPAPRYTIGLTNNFQYRDFSVSFAGRANLGNFVYNNVQTDIGNLARLTPSGYLSNVHRSAVDLNITEQAQATFSDYFVQDASFFRMDHITLSYRFKGLIGDFLQLYTTVQNPFVITKYEGLDPEIGDGIDNNIYPRSRTYLVGLSTQF